MTISGSLAARRFMSDWWLLLLIGLVEVPLGVLALADPGATGCARDRRRDLGNGDRGDAHHAGVRAQTPAGACRPRLGAADPQRRHRLPPTGLPVPPSPPGRPRASGLLISGAAGRRDIAPMSVGRRAPGARASPLVSGRRSGPGIRQRRAVPAAPRGTCAASPSLWRRMSSSLRRSSPRVDPARARSSPRLFTRRRTRSTRCCCGRRCAAAFGPPTPSIRSVTAVPGSCGLSSRQSRRL